MKCQFCPLLDPSNLPKSLSQGLVAGTSGSSLFLWMILLLFFFPLYYLRFLIKSLQDPVKKLAEKEDRKKIARQERAKATAEEPSQ